MNKQDQPKRMHIWRLLLWTFILWVAIAYVARMYGSNSELELSYSEFKALVSAGEIDEILVKGDRISGSFSDGYTVTTTTADDSVVYRAFTTTRPAFPDPKLPSLLEENGVTINAESENNSPILFYVMAWLPLLLIIGLFVYFRYRMQKGMGQPGAGLFGFGKSRAKRFEKTDSSVTFGDVAGSENAKRDLQEIVEYLRQPEKFSVVGANIPKGILLTGPPGTGKTLLARATAGEADVPFFSMSGSEFIEMFVGVGASRVRDLFETAKKEAPAIIFIDEIDSIGRMRGSGLGGGHDEREQTLNQILSEMDGFSAYQGVIVIAATNRPDVLDPALTRPGRFDRQIVIERPHKQARYEILRIHTREIPLADDVDLETLAARTVGFSGADLRNLANEAALLAGRKQKKQVTASDFEQARDKILLGNEREELLDDNEKKLIAFHEAGHALIARLLPNTDPLQKVTIIPRGRALGVTEQRPEKDRKNLSRNYLLDRIAVMLGGRVAEQLVFDDITTGAENDLKQATQLAGRMVCRWGMSDELGPVYYPKGEEHPFLGRELAQERTFSEETARQIDQEVRRIIRQMEEKTRDLLQRNRQRLDDLAQALLTHESLDDRAVDRIINLGGNSRREKEGQSRQPEPASA